MSPRRHPSTTHRAPPLVSAALLGLVLATSGCSLLGVGGASTQALADGSGFLVDAPASAGSEALVSGTLTLVGGDCVGLEDPGGGGGDVVLSFPHGSRPSDDGRGVVLPDGLEISLGDAVYGAGGYTGLDAPGVLDPWPDAPAGCRDGRTLAGIYDVHLGEPPQG